MKNRKPLTKRSIGVMHVLHERPIYPINSLLTDPIRNTKLIQKMVSHGVRKGDGGMKKELAVKGILDLINEFMKYAFDKQIGPARLYRRH